jgi:6-pyruvoyltetrahydropterin/6-carboxytetrahydropterin synthase
MFEICVSHTFPAAHFLREHPGKCAKLHGHNYRVEVTVGSPTLDRIGLVMDFADMKRALRTLCEKLDHELLNEIPPFDTLNPSAENIALFFYQQLNAVAAQPARITEVKVWESDTAWAAYRP